MLIGNRYMLKRYNSLDLSIKGYEINQVKSLKYLGLYIDDELRWDVYVNYLCEKVGRMISFLRRLTYFINRNSLNLIYRNVILPHLDYANVIWESSCEKHINQLQKLQNRAGRIILKVNPKLHFSVRLIHDILQWETLKSRQKFHVGVMMFKILTKA